MGKNLHLFAKIGLLLLITLIVIIFPGNLNVNRDATLYDNAIFSDFPETWLEAEVFNNHFASAEQQVPSPSPVPTEFQCETVKSEEPRTATGTPIPQQTKKTDNNSVDDFENPFPDLEMFTRDSDYEEIGYINDAAFKYIIDAYKIDDTRCFFESGDKSLYSLYKEKFRSLINLEERVYVKEIEQYLFLNDFDAESLSSYLHFRSNLGANEDYDPTQYWYYFFDFTGDGEPDLIICDPRSTLIIRYDKEADQLLLWKHYAPSPAIYGTLKVFWLGMNAHSRNLYTKLDENAEEDMHYFYYYTGYRLPDGGDGILYFVSLPHYADPSKNTSIPDEICQQAVYYTEYIRAPLFRLNFEQMELFQHAYVDYTYDVSEKNSYTYDELFGANKK